MTVFYPDLSHYNAGLSIKPGTAAVCAKATEGTSFRDAAYSDFQAQAQAAGAFFFAYHWIHRDNADAQAAFCHSVVGDVPVMIDCEDTNDVPTVADCLEFAHGMRARGGRCTVVYLPHWYWSGHLGSPDLRPLAAAGLGLVSSEYTAYSDTGPGWAPYGGVTPAIWQFSSTPYDKNAFRGSLDELLALLGGDMALEDFTNAQSNFWHQATRIEALAKGWTKTALGEDVSGAYKAIAAAVAPAVVAALPPAAAPTDAQVNAAVAAVMNDPAWLDALAARFGTALAAHVHVS